MSAMAWCSMLAHKFCLMNTVTKARRGEHCIILAVTEKKVDSRWSCPTGKMIYHPPVLRSQAGDYSMSVRTAAGAHIYCGLPQEEACSPFEVNIDQHAGIVSWIFFMSRVWNAP